MNTDFYRKNYKPAVLMCGLLVMIQVLTELLDVLAGLSTQVVQEFTKLDWFLFAAKNGCKISLLSLVTIKAFLDKTIAGLSTQTSTQLTQT